MSTIASIRKLYRDGESIAAISRKEGVSEPTVRKYVGQDDFSPRLPVREPRGSKLDPFKPIIDGWLESDRRTRRKQRHTATRVFDRLRDEEGYEGGYTTVQKYVREWKATHIGVQDEFLDQQWNPGEAQVDFGEADFRVAGILTTMFYLVVSFPFSNVGLSQLFFGVNSECVCQGLKNVFEFIGGVPERLVFDNATGVGRRIGESIQTAKTFQAFAAHYGFDYTFCNPYSGNEKGSVEAKVRYIRSNLFVPIPVMADVRAYNKALLPQCMSLSDKRHYLKNEPECQLFVEDAAALADLPAKPFDVVRYGDAKTDKYGKVRLEGRHWYPTSPAYAQRSLHVGYGAFEVSFYDEEGTLIAVHPRAYGDETTDLKDPASQLALLCKKPRGWVNSQMRATVPQPLREHIDGLDRKALRTALSAIEATSRHRGYELAVEAATLACEQVGAIEATALELLGARLAAGGQISYEKPADLAAYDMAIKTKEAMR